MYGPLIIRKVGNSLTVTISDIAKDLGLGEGGKLFAMRTPRGVELTPYYRVLKRLSIQRGTSCANISMP